jgi:hypothetical protein
MLLAVVIPLCLLSVSDRFKDIVITNHQVKKIVLNLYVNAGLSKILLDRLAAIAVARGFKKHLISAYRLFGPHAYVGMCLYSTCICW